MVVPFVNVHVPQGQPKVYLRHVGIQVVPDHCDFNKELDRYCIRPSLAPKAWAGVTPSSVVKALAVSMRLDWLALYRTDNLDAFEYLVDGFKRSQLIRISPYKAKSADATS